MNCFQCKYHPEFPQLAAISPNPTYAVLHFRGTPAQSVSFFKEFENCLNLNQSADNHDCEI